MALLRFKKIDMDDDEECFKDRYDDEEVAGGYEAFMNYYGADDNEEIDLQGKVLVSLCSIDDYSRTHPNIPIKILTLFVDEGERFKYKPKLIYSGHIAFLIIEREDETKEYFYKDDECCPQTFDEMVEYHSSAFYTAKELGFTPDDILKQIEMVIQTSMDFNYKLKKEDIIFLEGL